MRSPGISACFRCRRGDRKHRPPTTRKRIRVSFLHASWLASLPAKVRNRLIWELTRDAAQRLKYEWEYRARTEQLPPPGNWRVWLLLAGRGFGKTRSGAEFVRTRVGQCTARHIALIAPTAADARNVMIEGESG